LFLAAGWIVLWEPEALLGASFQLSFGATLAILVVFPFLRGEGRPTVIGVRGNLKRWLTQAVLMGLVVYIGIWPLLVYYFRRLSWAGLFANWTVFPLSGVLMVAGLIAGSWGVIAPHSVPGWIIAGVHSLVHLTLQVIKCMAGWSWAVRPIDPLPGWACWLYYGFLFGILLVFRRRKNHEKNRSRLQRG
jgi:competence protein ComEC